MHLDKAVSSPLELVNQGWTDVVISNHTPEPSDLSTEYSMVVWTESDSSAADSNLYKSNSIAQSSCTSCTAPEIPVLDSRPNPKTSSYSDFEAVDNDCTMNSDASPVCKDSQFAKGSGKAILSPPRLLDNVDINGKAAFFIGDDDGSSFQENKEDTFYLQNKSSRKGKTNESYAKKTKNQVEPIPEFTPPDGGYGWVVAMSACIVNLFIMGIVRSYGVLYVSIAQRFPEASAYEASWLPVLLSTTGLLLAPVTGVLCRKFTSRKVSIAGGLLSFAGLFLGAFARSVMEMILSFGLLTGLGVGLTTTPAVLVTSLYFNTRRALASAICVSGNALGAFVFPPLIELLLSHYGFQGAMIIIGALQLNICAASMLFRPITLHALMQKKDRMLKEKNERMEKGQKEKAINYCVIKRNSLIIKNGILALQPAPKNTEDKEINRQVSFLRSSSMVNSIPDLAQYALSWANSSNQTINRKDTVSLENEACMQTHFGSSADIHHGDVKSPNIADSKLEMEEETAAPSKTNCCLFLCRFFDCSLMKSSKFLLVNLSVFLVGAASPHAVFFLPAYATSLNMDRTAVVSVLSIAAVADLIGRLGTGFVADRNILSSNIIYAICVALGGSGLVLLPLVHSYEGLVFLMSLYGFGVGAWFVMVPTILAKDHGVQRLAASYGLVRMFNGFMNFISPQISDLKVSLCGNAESLCLGYDNELYFFNSGFREADSDDDTSEEFLALGQVLYSNFFNDCLIRDGLLIDVTLKYEFIYIFMGSCMLAGSVIMVAKVMWSSLVNRRTQQENGR